MSLIVELGEKIYNDGKLPLDFVNNIFIPLPKSSKAVRCEDHRTISLKSYAARNVGTICQLRIMTEICRKMQKHPQNICFIYFTKAFDRVNHAIIFEILVKAGVPDI